MYNNKMVYYLIKITSFTQKLHLDMIQTFN